MGLHPKHYEEIIEKKANQDIKIGEPINFKMVEL